MNNKIYLHAIHYRIDELYDSKETMQILSKILKKKQLLSLRLQRKFTNNGFTGKDYISLVDYDKRFLYSGSDPEYNAFNGYIRNSLSLLFSDIDVIEPTIIKPINTDPKGYLKMDRLGRSKNERYTDFADEVQVKDRISLEHMKSLTLPTWMFVSKNDTTSENVKFIKDELDRLYDTLLFYGYDVPIRDIDTLDEIKDKSDIEMVLTKIKNH